MKMGDPSAPMEHNLRLWFTFVVIHTHKKKKKIFSSFFFLYLVHSSANGSILSFRQKYFQIFFFFVFSSMRVWCLLCKSTLPCCDASNQAGIQSRMTDRLKDLTIISTKKIKEIIRYFSQLGILIKMTYFFNKCLCHLTLIHKRGTLTHAACSYLF